MELTQIPARNLADHVVNRGLKEIGSILGD